ncbi:glycoside hydrolase family 127 protein [Kribbella sp. NPDC048928]|uniref:glycoside hydrolase family 127 protein n=1 Tax=Kribbella sp. NPDC048928 TaxID=3364111 RepID=UPI003723C47E
MTTTDQGPAAPVAATALRPLGLRDVQLAGSFLGDLQATNATVSIPKGAEHLDEQWANFRNVAEGVKGADYHGPNYEDGEAYKWLEAVAWEAGRDADQSTDPRLAEWLQSRTALIAAAQDDDGYLGTFVQSGQRDERYGQLDFDHEIFNMGAMIQSAVAQYRATGRTELLDVARRAGDHLHRTFGIGPEQREGFCGHPVAELALVELYRATGEQRYLDQAKYFVDAHGRSILAPDHPGRAAYLSDRIPVRETTTPEGHAVRAIYLAAGATDVAIETGDTDLLAKLETQWQNMVGTKMYVNGGLGSRWDGESFGNPYELPNDIAYGETCAAVASVQWSWRLLLATGKARYADLIEWQLYNAVLPGVSLDRSKYFYVNALQVRADSDDADKRAPGNGRQPWFGTSCCPTNLMRTFAALQHYVATSNEDGVQLHQYAAGSIRAGELRLTVSTDYPVSGRIVITVDEGADTAISLRIPSWAAGAEVVVADGEAIPGMPGAYTTVRRAWQQGDRLVLTLPMSPRLLHGHPRVEGIRGSVAISRGPLLYAVEQADHTAPVDDLALTATTLSEIPAADGPPQVTGTGAAWQPSTGLYADEPAALGDALRITAVPYYQWGNRELGPMKVWLPLAT